MDVQGPAWNPPAQSGSNVLHPEPSPLAPLAPCMQPNCSLSGTILKTLASWVNAD